MSKKIFSNEEIKKLSINKYVKNVSEKVITYTNEFKLHFIAEYEIGKTPRQIFEYAGFDIDMIGIKRVQCASRRWRKPYKDKGVLGLEDTRTLNSGRTLNRELTLEEILAKKDSSTNEILAYYLSKSIAIDLVTETINKLVKLKSFKLHKDAFVHSDQGAHYTSPIFQRLLKDNNLGQSMSRRGNCWDNAPQESFFGHMKDEIDYISYNTFDELQIVVGDYMDYYNNFRCQWNLKKLTPIQFRNQLLMAV